MFLNSLAEDHDLDGLGVALLFKKFDGGQRVLENLFGLVRFVLVWFG